MVLKPQELALSNIGMVQAVNLKSSTSFSSIMSFDNEKQQALNKIRSDKSKKGSVDIEILELVNLINSHPDYYTTSSCAGRIMLFLESARKKGSAWLLLSHEPLTLQAVKRSIKPTKETLWLRMEPPILHICAKSMDAAEKLLNMANDAGFRRSSILGLKKRIIIEIMIPEKLDSPVAEDDKIIVDEKYLRTLIRHANLRLRISRTKLKKFQKSFYLFSKTTNSIKNSKNPTIISTPSKTIYADELKKSV